MAQLQTEPPPPFVRVEDEDLDEEVVEKATSNHGASVKMIKSLNSEEKKAPKHALYSEREPQERPWSAPHAQQETWDVSYQTLDQSGRW